MTFKRSNSVNTQWNKLKTKIKQNKNYIGTTFTQLDHRTSKPIKLDNKQEFFTHLCNGVLRLPSLLSMTAPYRTRSSTNVKWPCLAAKWSGDLHATQSMASMSAPCRNSKSTTPSWPPMQATWRGVEPSLSRPLTKSLKEVNRLEAYGKKIAIIFTRFIYESAFHSRFGQSIHVYKSLIIRIIYLDKKALLIKDHKMAYHLSYQVTLGDVLYCWCRQGGLCIIFLDIQTDSDRKTTILFP